MSDDFDFEPVKGLPEVLPAQERMLWRGAPRWQDLAVHAFHARKVFVYFVLLGGVEAAGWLANGNPVSKSLVVGLWFVLLGVAAAGLLTGLALASARTSVYTITNKRLVMRIGIALPITINLPFKQLDQASVKLYHNGSGEISVSVTNDTRVSYMLFWPHVRRWYLSRPQPTLRCVANADKVASLLAAALASAPLPAMPDVSPAELHGVTGTAVPA